MYRENGEPDLLKLLMINRLVGNTRLTIVNRNEINSSRGIEKLHVTIDPNEKQ